MAKISISMLRNNDIPGFIEFLVRAIEKEDPETIGVKVFLEELKNSLSELELLTEPNTASKYTNLIEKDRAKIKRMCLAIVTQARASSMANMTEHNNAVFMLVPLITKYLILAKKSNWSEYRKKINSFLLAVQSTEEMKNACRTIGIDIYITELLTLKAQLDANFVLRHQENVVRSAIRERNIRKVILKRVSNLLSAIELAKVTNKTFDFGPLTTELNEGFSKYHALFSSRNSRNLNKVIKKESVDLTTKSVATETRTVGA